MATQRIFDNIMNEFNSDEEEENEESDMSKHSDEMKQHKKSSSLNENSNNIKDKIFNTNREIIKKYQTKKRKRDEFGYFINNDEENNEEKNENEEKSDSNENKDEELEKEENNEINNDDLENNSQKKDNENSLNSSRNEEEEREENDENDKDNNENEKELENDEENNNEENQENNEIEQNEINDKENEVEENIEDNVEQDDNERENNNFEENNENNIEQNDINENENSIEENKENDVEQYDNNEDNIEHNEEQKEIENEKNEERNISNEKNENENENEKDDENNLINELYEKNKTENIEQIDFENFRMGSFRPKPIPGSPKFSKRISKSDEAKVENKEKKDNNEKNPNYNLNNFTETIETTIEGDKVQTKESINKNIPVYTHNNLIISLGKIPIKESINNNNELLNKHNKNSKEENQHKNSENEEKAEEDFLKREEIKRQKNKDEKKNEIKEKIENKENKNTLKKEEEDGKENVTEEEEDKKIHNNNNSKIKKENENIQNEIKEDSKEYILSSINTLNNESIYLDQKSSINHENDIKIISTKLLTDYQNAGNSQNESVKHSHKNSGSKKKNNNNIVIQENKKLEPINIGVKRNVFSKKLPSDRYLNKNNNSKKINKNPMPVMNNVVYNSPSNKNFKNNNINNYSIDQNNNISTNNKDISPFNYNNISNQSKQIDSNKKKHELKKMKNKLYNESIENNFKKSDTQEKFPFKPQINQRSRDISEKKLNNIKNNYNINDNNNLKGTSLGLLLLYEDANIKQEKLNQEHIKQNNDIISKANIKKINDVSYNMVNERLNKKINNAISKFGKKEENKIVLNIVNMTQCLYELNIINELIKPKDNLQDININNQIDLSELQAMIEASEKKKDIKKLEEVELIEQLWYLLNPELKPNLDSEILCIFLKLFFCGNETQKNLEKLIISLLDEYKISHKEKNEEEYKSSLRAKKYKINEIWNLDKFIKVFLTLKKNLKAYRENDYTKGDVYNNIIKEKDKELTFEPNFISNNYFYKYSQFQYNKDNSLIDLINKYKNKNQNSQKQKHDFNKVYERFKEEKERHDKTLQKIRQMQEEDELKMCTNVPKINKYIPKLRNESNSPSTEKKKKILDTEEKIYNVNKTNKKQPRYKLLYNLHQKYNKRDKIEKRIDKSDILDENCTFVPKISNIDIMNRTFSNIKKKKKPKGFNDYVNRNRSVLEKKEHEKKIEDDKRYGRNYDKMQKNKIKIKPLNITDLSKSASKAKKNKQFIINSNTNSKNKYNLNTEKNDNIIKDVYINLDIKTPSGIIKQLKIYNKTDKNTIEDINSFCKIYSLNEEVKKMLIKKAIQYKYNFFGKNLEKKRNNFLNNEDSIS